MTRTERRIIASTKLNLFSKFLCHILHELRAPAIILSDAASHQDFSKIVIHKNFFRVFSSETIEVS